jgi:AraC family transcriptional activator of mtrCDE
MLVCTRFLSDRTFLAESMDALSSLLQAMSPRGHVFFTGEVCGDFAVDTSGTGCPQFHVIARGLCWLQTEGWEEERPLQAGDLVMFPRDAGHTLLPHPPGQPASKSGGGGYVSLICGYYEFASRRIDPILAVLPDVLVVREAEYQEGGSIGNLLQFMKHETQREAPGRNMVIDRLSEVLFLFILRALTSDPMRSPEFLRAFADPATARALSAIHEEPYKPWTVASLARVAALSRTAFANRFHDLVGMTPLAYLTHYRMDLAADWLRQDDMSIEDVAARCGYTSSAAFAKAFKKETGRTPGVIRRAGR